jgi:hypothetical protein
MSHLQSSLLLLPACMVVAFAGHRTHCPLVSDLNDPALQGTHDSGFGPPYPGEHWHRVPTSCAPRAHPVALNSLRVNTNVASGDTWTIEVEIWPVCTSTRNNKCSVKRHTRMHKKQIVCTCRSLHDKPSKGDWSSAPTAFAAILTQKLFDLVNVCLNHVCTVAHTHRRRRTANTTHAYTHTHTRVRFWSSIPAVPQPCLPLSSSLN